MFVRRLEIILLGAGVVGMTVAAAHAQSAMPQFSDPYGGLRAHLHNDAPGSETQHATKSAAQKMSFRRHAVAKRRVAPASPGLAADLLAQPVTGQSRPQISSRFAGTKSDENPLGFDLKWSAENDPHFNTATSTVPAVDEIKRNANETPAENGSTIDGGLHFKF